jgi:signal transduction histidine kinase
MTTSSLLPAPSRRAPRDQRAPELGATPRTPPAHHDRLSSLGLATACVAHELASPIAVVIANLGFAIARLAEASASDQAPDAAAVLSIQAALRDGLDAAERLRTISSELRSLSRARPDAGETIVVGRAIERALAMTRGEVQARGVVERRLAPVPPIRGSEGRLVQVLINLLVNAAHAIPPGAPDRHRVTVSAEVAAPGRVVIAVADTGSGIAPEVLPRIFEPFFTTKPSGLGLGLAVCRDLVSSLGGQLEVESAPGQGTTVRIVLPTGTR